GRGCSAALRGGLGTWADRGGRAGSAGRRRTGHGAPRVGGAGHEYGADRAPRRQPRGGASGLGDMRSATARGTVVTLRNAAVYAGSNVEIAFAVGGRGRGCLRSVPRSRYRGYSWKGGA